MMERSREKPSPPEKVKKDDQDLPRGDPRSDEELLRAGQEGIEELGRRHFERFKRVAWGTRLLNNGEEVEEVTQTAWEKIMRSFRRQTTVRHFWAFSIRTIYNTARDFRRAEGAPDRRGVDLEGAVTVDDPQDAPGSSIENRERNFRCETFWKEVGLKVSRGERQILGLMREGLKAREIAKVLGRKQEAVHAACYRIRKKALVVLEAMGIRSAEDLYGNKDFVFGRVQKARKEGSNECSS